MLGAVWAQKIAIFELHFNDEVLWYIVSL